MATTCPNGHQSGTDDYCDQCGSPLTVAGPVEDVDDSSVPLDVAPVVRDPEPCPRCRTLRVEDDPFCESCGHQFGVDDAPPSWQVVITADRTFYDRMAPSDVGFPSEPVHRVVALSDAEILIGRRSASRGVDPEIDCSGPPEDPGVSHRHALLVRGAEGNYAVCDVGSTNGTRLNDSGVPAAKNVLLPLRDGDRIHVGAWTTLTVVASGADVSSVEVQDGPST